MTDYSQTIPGLRRGNRAQALVEFALVLPFLILLLTAIVDFGYYLYDVIGTHAALRAGAQAAVLAGPTDNPYFSNEQLARIMEDAHGPVNEITNSEISVTPLANDPAFGGNYTSVTLRIAHVHEFMFPVYMLGRDASVTIISQIKTLRVPGLAP